MLVHYHIEKTAGSSFRDLCFDYFGPDAVAGLYGVGSRSTTANVREIAFPGGCQTTIPERADAVSDYLMRSQPAFFSSHMIAPIRSRLSGDIQSVAFFREPLSRLVSHYNHWKLKGYFTGGFHEFYQTPKFCNWQSRRLPLKEMENLTCVGITERFNESLDVINARLGLKLAPRHGNKTPWRLFQVDAKKLNDATRQQIIELNALDFELYQAAHERLERDIASV